MLSLFAHQLSAQNFDADFDAARFGESDSTGRLELYFTFYHEGMTSEISENDTLIEGGLLVKFFSRNDKIALLNKKYVFSQSKNESDALTGILKFSFPEGQYICELRAEDLNSKGATDSISFVFNIDGLNEKLFSVSDIQFASSLDKSNPASKTIFSKNNYEVVPNTSGIYGQDLPVLYFYTELYNLSRGSKSEYLTVGYSIENQFGISVYKRERKVSSKLTAVPFVQAINVSGFETGSYQMKISLKDEEANKQATSFKRFTIYNPGVVDTTGNQQKYAFHSEYSQMTENQLDEVFSMCVYIATSAEISVWKGLQGVEAKRSFLDEFWKRRDNDGDPAINRFKYEYFQRIEIANKRFNTMGKEGWQTDRGRVFCIYGEPNEVERYPNRSFRKPYEIWNYFNIEGGVIFVFAELYSYSEMTLLHSTKIGELQDPSWEEKIQVHR